MQRARPLKRDTEAASVRGAASAAPRETPLTMVSGAVAGDDLQSVARSASEALRYPVAIALPALGAPVLWPVQAGPAQTAATVATHAAAVIRGNKAVRLDGIADWVAIRIGQEVVGIVAALGEQALPAEQRPWLEAAAAAATVAALMRDGQAEDPERARGALVQAIAEGMPPDQPELLARARRLGFELGSGAVAFCAQLPQDTDAGLSGDVLLASVEAGRVLGLVPLQGVALGTADALADDLRARGITVALSTPRRDPATLREAILEAELLLEVAVRSEALLAGQEETYRLLIGVLLRDRSELELLRERTIAPLGAYDREHDTELLATLQSFFAHHGSTTETAEAMRLHRHTVGYRLSRVQEVSGLSPYESDGRERLSLGLKAHQILEADGRRVLREQARAG